MSKAIAFPEQKSALAEPERHLFLGRQLFTDGFLNRGALEAWGPATEWGLACWPDSLSLGDHRLVGLIVSAGRAPGFGEKPVDAKIQQYLDGTYGVGRWQRDRAPHPWEPGGGDAELDRLHAECEAAIAAHKTAEAAMWAARDEMRAGTRGMAPGEPATKLLRALAAAVEQTRIAWEAAHEAEGVARCRETARAVYLARRAGSTY